MEVVVVDDDGWEEKRNGGRRRETVATWVRVKWKGLSVASKSLQLSQESSGDGGMIGGDQGNMGNIRKPQGLGALGEEGTKYTARTKSTGSILGCKLNKQCCSTQEAARP